jgi:hypothetical protein
MQPAILERFIVPQNWGRPGEAGKSGEFPPQKPTGLSPTRKILDYPSRLAPQSPHVLFLPPFFVLFDKQENENNVFNGSHGRRFERPLKSLASKMEIMKIGELLNWSYANLAMAHAAVTTNSEKYGRTHFMIRARLFKGLNNQTLHIGQFAEDERLKLFLPQACCYCGSKENLSADHLIPTKRGGENKGENLVWACRTCNSSKGAKDVLEWLQEKQQFPPLLLLRRHLKLALEICRAKDLLNLELSEAPELPFSLAAIPTAFPQPRLLKLWVLEMS